MVVSEKALNFGKTSVWVVCGKRVVLSVTVLGSGWEQSDLVTSSPVETLRNHEVLTTLEDRPLEPAHRVPWLTVHFSHSDDSQKLVATFDCLAESDSLVINSTIESDFGVTSERFLFASNQQLASSDIDFLCVESDVLGILRVVQEAQSTVDGKFCENRRVDVKNHIPTWLNLYLVTFDGQFA